jgi:hypothetical protein
VAQSGGLHRLRVAFADHRWKQFKDECSIGWSKQRIWQWIPKVEVSGPNVDRQPLPASWLLRNLRGKKRSGYPQQESDAQVIENHLPGARGEMVWNGDVRDTHRIRLPLSSARADQAPFWIVGGRIGRECHEEPEGQPSVLGKWAPREHPFPNPDCLFSKHPDDAPRPFLKNAQTGPALSPPLVEKHQERSPYAPPPP